MSLSDIMSAADLGSWAEIGLIVSFLTFVFIVVWVFRRRRSSWDHLRQLPLEPDDPRADDSGGTLR